MEPVVDKIKDAWFWLKAEARTEPFWMFAMCAILGMVVLTVSVVAVSGG